MSEDRSAPTPVTLQDALGYGQRGYVDRPTQSAHKFTPTNDRLRGDTPILRVMRPLVRRAEKAGVPVTHLSVGSLKRTPPDALYKRMIADGRHPEGYPQAYGEQPLLDELARYLTAMTGVEIVAEDSCITSGGISNIVQVLHTCTELGDTVCVIRPSWPNTPVVVRQLGRRCYSLHASPDNAWAITPELLAQVPLETRLLVIERPGNPTAVGWTDAELEVVRNFMMLPERRGLVLYADEEYYEICEGRPRSILELGLSRVISGSAWSKNICATSIRLGRLTTLDRRIRQLFVPFWNLYLGSTNWMNVQHAIAAILNDFGPDGLPAYVFRLNAEMAEKRRIAIEVFDGMRGARLIRGTGAIYDILVLDGVDDHATQMLLWRIVESLKLVESGADGEIPEVPYAVPLSGFQDKFNGYDCATGTPRDSIHGFRVTYTIEGEALRRALTSLRRMVEDWRAAGSPRLGRIEEVTARIFAGQPIEYTTVK